MQVHFYPKRKPGSFVKLKNPPMTIQEYKALEEAGGVLLLKKKAYQVKHVFPGVFRTKKGKEKPVIHIVLEKKS
jgi:hypothetical protein